MSFAFANQLNACNQCGSLVLKKNCGVKKNFSTIVGIRLNFALQLGCKTIKQRVLKLAQEKKKKSSYNLILN